MAHEHRRAATVWALRPFGDEGGLAYNMKHAGWHYGQAHAAYDAAARRSGLGSVRGVYPEWAKLCACLESEERNPECSICDGARWHPGDAPVCLDCGHQGCPFCNGWCDVLTASGGDDDADMDLCCDGECRYPLSRPPRGADL